MATAGGARVELKGGEMRICPQCHAAARLDESICAWCGAELPPQREDAGYRLPAQSIAPGSVDVPPAVGWPPPSQYQYPPAPSSPLYTYQPPPQTAQYPYQPSPPGSYPYASYGGASPTTPYGAPPPHGEHAAAPWQPVYVTPAPRRMRVLPFVLVGVGVAVVLAILVPIYLLNAGGAASGTWYGPFGINTVDGYTRAEVLLNVHQTSDGSIWGSGEMCVLSGQQTQTGSFPMTGRASGASLDITWQISDPSLNIQNLDWQGTVNGQTMMLSYTGKGQTGYAFTLRRGDRSAYLAACQAST